MAKLSKLDFWRLADDLSVVNAAILICGEDPSDWTNDQDGNRVQLTWQHDGYDAAFAALRGAVLANKLPANVKHSMRAGRTGFAEPDCYYEITEQPHEEQISYDLLIARNAKSGGYNTAVDGQTLLNFTLDTLRSERLLYICKEPNWEQTMLDVTDIRNWLKSKDLFPEFFFPKGSSEGFRDENNDRYAPKLACAVAAWEAVKHPMKNKSVKQTLQYWIQSNGVKFGMGENSVVSPTAAEEVAKIVNWNPKGGANLTSPTAEDDYLDAHEKSVENYGYGYPKTRDLDPDIPF